MYNVIHVRYDMTIVIARSALYVRAHSLNLMSVSVFVRSFVRPLRKNVTFVLADRRGGHMLESKHDLKLENCRILQGPEKRGPKLSITG